MTMGVPSGLTTLDLPNQALNWGESVTATVVLDAVTCSYLGLCHLDDPLSFQPVTRTGASCLSVTSFSSEWRRFAQTVLAQSTSLRATSHRKT